MHYNIIFKTLKISFDKKKILIGKLQHELISWEVHSEKVILIIGRNYIVFTR